MKKMNIAVIGLGMEGKKSVKALLDYGNHVYASDINDDVGISEFKDSNLDVDLGFHDSKKIDSSDAVVLSPSLWDKNISKKVIEEDKLLSDVLNRHKSIFTIGVTGTNGKTTTCHMLNEILTNAGLNVLLGGNAGGGFEGYTKLVLEANEDNYDVMIVEVCDMTLDFASYVFEFDMVLVTNLGYDHMEFHGSLENYVISVCKFLKDKKVAILNKKDVLLEKCENCADNTYYFSPIPLELKLFGSFNQENAAGASKAAELLDISPMLIKKVLGNFEGVDGRTRTIKIKDSNIIIGKTDNPDAAVAVFNEAVMDVIIVGTPRRNEKFRYDIIKEVSKANPSLVVLFPGLDDTTNTAHEILRESGYNGPVKIVEELSEIVDLVEDFTNIYENIFIGGNGQKKIMSLQKSLFQLNDR
jgi:UDP-N-acetylmuramoylalanine--D-glutamate ligase